MTPRLLLLGGGGHAGVLTEMLLDEGRPVAGYVAPDDTGPLREGITYLGDDEWLTAQDPSAWLLVNGVGSTADTRPRRALFERFTGLGFRFATLCHPTAWLARSAQVAPGTQLLPGATVSSGARLEENVLVNTRAVVEHDCRVGAHSHIASGAVLCGGCRLGEGVHLGASAVVVQGIEIGAGAIVAAGAVVTRNVEPLTLVAGVPARVKRRQTQP